MKKRKEKKKEKEFKELAREQCLEAIIKLQAMQKDVTPGSAEYDDLQKAIDAKYENYISLAKEKNDSTRNKIDVAKTASNVVLTGTTIGCTFKREQAGVITSKLFGFLPKLKNN